jgi:hypothetical protein
MHVRLNTVELALAAERLDTAARGRELDEVLLKWEADKAELEQFRASHVQVHIVSAVDVEGAPKTHSEATEYKND